MREVGRDRASDRERDEQTESDSGKERARYREIEKEREQKFLKSGIHNLILSYTCLIQQYIASKYESEKAKPSFTFNTQDPLQNLP